MEAKIQIDFSWLQQPTPQHNPYMKSRLAPKIEKPKKSRICYQSPKEIDRISAEWCEHLNERFTAWRTE